MRVAWVKNPVNDSQPIGDPLKKVGITNSIRLVRKL
jgi:hypothetical protein